MKFHNYPVGYGKFIINREKNPLSSFIKLGFVSFLKCKIRSPLNIKIPVLPYRKNDGGVIYPIGEWEGVYFSEELELAEENGYDIQVLFGYLYETRNIFSEFVDYFYKRKVETNSLYHK
jgi:hypothetical protein